jgi:hypothetical protein
MYPCLSVAIEAICHAPPQGACVNTSDGIGAPFAGSQLHYAAEADWLMLTGSSNGGPVD